MSTPDDDDDLITEHTTMLANRLRKRVRHLRKWARRESVTCWRLYDGDIPELPLAIDWYDGALHVFVAEGRGGARHVDDEVAWVEALVATAREVVGQLLEPVGDDAVFVKSRQRTVDRREDQYQRHGDRPAARRVVEEGGHRFEVELARRHDTGLFLDHRQTRARVGERADGRRVLNLYCYTGAFTVYAAMGSARTTTSVDLSKTYLEWTRRNLELNLAPEDHESIGLWLPTPGTPHGAPPQARHLLVRADVMALLAEARERGWRYDLAVVDPPTFSTSKQTEDTFDVQRDHVALLQAVAACMAPGGEVVFSTNRRRFKWQLEIERLGAGWQGEEITTKTVGPDFHGQPHRCWWLTRRP